MKTAFKCLLTLMAICLATPVAFAQEVEMADAFRAEGKIYVVVAIVLIVLIGLVAYLFVLDRKLNKLEQMIQRKQTKHNGKSF